MVHYCFGVVIHPNVTIGDHVWIYHNVTLAADSQVGSRFRINIGDHATIGAKAIVLGNGACSISIGKGSIIGAGSVVTKDIPDGEIWAGNPAKFLKVNPRWNGKTVRRWSSNHAGEAAAKQDDEIKDFL